MMTFDILDRIQTSSSNHTNQRSTIHDLPGVSCIKQLFARVGPFFFYSLAVPDRSFFTPTHANGTRNSGVDFSGGSVVTVDPPPTPCLLGTTERNNRASTTSRDHREISDVDIREDGCSRCRDLALAGVCWRLCLSPLPLGNPRVAHFSAARTRTVCKAAPRGPTRWGAICATGSPQEKPVRAGTGRNDMFRSRPAHPSLDGG